LKPIGDGTHQDSRWIDARLAHERDGVLHEGAEVVVEHEDHADVRLARAQPDLRARDDPELARGPSGTAVEELAVLLREQVDDLAAPR
jgi:hypothetical protein